MLHLNTGFANGICTSRQSYLINRCRCKLCRNFAMFVEVGSRENVTMIERAALYVQSCFLCFGKFKSQQGSSQILECPDESLFETISSSFLHTLNQISFQVLCFAK